MSATGCLAAPAAAGRQSARRPSCSLPSRPRSCCCNCSACTSRLEIIRPEASRLRGAASRPASCGPRRRAAAAASPSAPAGRRPRPSATSSTEPPGPTMCNLDLVTAAGRLRHGHVVEIVGGDLDRDRIARRASGRPSAWRNCVRSQTLPIDRDLLQTQPQRRRPAFKHSGIIDAEHGDGRRAAAAGPARPCPQRYSSQADLTAKIGSSMRTTSGSVAFGQHRQAVLARGRPFKA